MESNWVRISTLAVRQLRGRRGYALKQEWPTLIYRPLIYSHPLFDTPFLCVRGLIYFHLFSL